MFLSMNLRMEEARREIAVAHKLDPLSQIISTAVGRIYHFSRRYDEAIEQCRRTLELNPEFVPAYFDLAVSCAAAGDFPAARQAIDTMYEFDKNEVRHSMMMAFWSARQGLRDEATEWESRFRAGIQGEQPPPTLLALMETSLGNLDLALDLIEKAVETRESMLVYLQCEPTWDPLRQLPRYKRLIQRMGFLPAPEGADSGCFAL